MLKTNIICDVIHNFLYNPAYFSEGLLKIGLEFPVISGHKQVTAEWLFCVFLKHWPRLYISLSFQAENASFALLACLQITAGSVAQPRKEKSFEWPQVAGAGGNTENAMLLLIYQFLKIFYSSDDIRTHVLLSSNSHDLHSFYHYFR